MIAKQPQASDPGSTVPRAETPPVHASTAAAAAPAAQATGAAARRPYQAPRVVFREPLEAMASICSPHPPAKGNKGVCPMGPISS